ncbi:MAG: site-2 protease family protein [Bacilli bacterium]|nr:site-2 protease family protein [Bacilli bacterium]
MSLIIFHEFGHFLAALLFKYKIDKIYIYPLGGIIKFNDYINRKVYQELLVTITGPLFQIILSLFLVRFDKDIVIFSNLLLFFNLLPIVPLDGSKILSCFLNLIIPYKKSLTLCIYLSFIFLLFSFFYSYFNYYSFIIIISLFLLLFKIFDELKLINYSFDKFLLERYLYQFKFRKTKVIRNIKDMYKYRNNLFIVNNKIYNEKEILVKYFSNKL